MFRFVVTVYRYKFVDETGSFSTLHFKYGYFILKIAAILLAKTYSKWSKLDRCFYIHSSNNNEVTVFLTILLKSLFVLCSPPDFIPSLKRLFNNSIYSLMILTYLVVVNGFIGMITFKPKFLEQIYGQSASKAIFLIGTEQ